MTEAEALRELKRIGEQYKHDAETAHDLAEAVLLTMVPDSVRAQYVDMRWGLGFKY